MSRRNHPKRTQQARRRPADGAPKPTHHLSPIPLEKMIVPHGKCGRKARFDTEKEAAGALAQAQLNRKINGKLHAEKRYYKCDRAGCGGWHLTSREAWSPPPGKGE